MFLRVLIFSVFIGAAIEGKASNDSDYVGFPEEGLTARCGGYLQRGSVGQHIEDLELAVNLAIRYPEVFGSERRVRFLLDRQMTEHFMGTELRVVPARAIKRLLLASSPEGEGLRESWTQTALWNASIRLASVWMSEEARKLVVDAMTVLLIAVEEGVLDALILAGITMGYDGLFLHPIMSEEGGSPVLQGAEEEYWGEFLTNMAQVAQQREAFTFIPSGSWSTEPRRPGYSGDSIEIRAFGVHGERGRLFLRGMSFEKLVPSPTFFSDDPNEIRAIHILEEMPLYFSEEFFPRVLERVHFDDAEIRESLLSFSRDLRELFSVTRIVMLLEQIRRVGMIPHFVRAIREVAQEEYSRGSRAEASGSIREYNGPLMELHIRRLGEILELLRSDN